ncbi:MAG TPA: NAD(P)-binding domain-containing protein [Motilibacteraceae bacterium]|nr:NAD(P)-binding domain-containing protein [Motilibacteraceae bacterium]
MPTIDTVVIGAGHAGLAVSRLLTDAGRDHVVLERGQVAERWRSERWDSLHLLTPNWMTRLPGWWYAGPDREGYLSVRRFVRHLERYAGSFDAPVLTGTTVHALTARPGGGYRVTTDQGGWHAEHVVIATGPHGVPRVPAGFEPGPDGVAVLTSNRYRNPAQLAPGGVLVVGASASGVQIADELSRSGHRVVLAVGRHTRIPRRYRGMDIFWWLETTGRLARTIDDMPDPEAARAEASLQLAGHTAPERFGQDVDLATLQQQGVRLVGRVQGVGRRTVDLGGNLADDVSRADAKLHRLLDSIDAYADDVGLAAEVWDSSRPRRVRITESPARLDLLAEGIGTVVLATGYRPHHPWLQLPVLAPDGHVRQRRGVTPAPGVYVVGQRFQHRRDSGFIDGARHDAAAVVGHLLGTGPVSLADPSEESAA